MKNAWMIIPHFRFILFNLKLSVKYSHSLFKLFLCLERTCEALQDLEYGYFRNARASYEIGSVISFTCMDGFKISGNSSLYCMAIGWSDSQPTCIGKITISSF